MILALTLLVTGCTPTAPPPPPQLSDTDSLLVLVARLIETPSADERRRLEQAERERFKTAPDEHNRLRLAMVRAYSAALPAELKEAQDDLRVLVTGPRDLSDNQRHLALMALIMVDERLQMGTQIVNLQQKIDSLTEIEASLNDNEITTDDAAESSP